MWQRFTSESDGGLYVRRHQPLLIVDRQRQRFGYLYLYVYENLRLYCFTFSQGYPLFPFNVILKLVSSTITSATLPSGIQQCSTIKTVTTMCSFSCETTQVSVALLFCSVLSFDSDGHKGRFVKELSSLAFYQLVL